MLKKRKMSAMLVFEASPAHTVAFHEITNNTQIQQCLNINVATNQKWHSLHEQAHTGITIREQQAESVYFFHLNLSKALSLHPKKAKAC